jgi:hypothetical protein
MSLFVFSTFAGFLLYQIVARIQPITGSGSYRFGKLVEVKLPERSYLVWKAASISIAVTLFILVVILIVAQGAHPAEGFPYRFVDALTSPRMAAALFGGLVGLLLGNLLNRILWGTSEYKFTSSDRIEMILIFFLFILGIGGEEVLRSTAQRINKVSVGTTTEISFSENKPRNSRAAAEQPGAAFRNTASESGGSTGLGKLGDLRDNIGPIEPALQDKYRSDVDFLTLIALYEMKSAPSMPYMGTLPADVLSPIGTCLSGIYRLFGDAAFVRYQLGFLTFAARDLAMSKDLASTSTRDASQQPAPGSNYEPQTIKYHIKGNLADRIRQIAEYARINEKEFKDADLERRFSCNEIIKAAGNNQILDDKDPIGAFWNSREASPYPAIAYASVEAALSNYESAATTMHNWIEKQKKKLKGLRDQKSEDSLREKWYLVRARFAQASFVDEWIRSRGVAASSWLRQYHIENLKALADEMHGFNAIWTVSQKNREYKWSNTLLGVSYSGDDGLCDYGKPATGGKAREVTEEGQATLRKLYDSYLSVRNDYVDHALKHPIVKLRLATIIHNEIKELMALDLRCIEDSRTRIRAEYIERYVRSEINLMEGSSPLKSSDEVRRRIRDSQQLLALAFQLIEPEVTRKRDAKNNARLLQSRIETDSLLELYETLLATQSQLQDFSEREVTP